MTSSASVPLASPPSAAARNISPTAATRGLAELDARLVVGGANAIVVRAQERATFAVIAHASRRLRALGAVVIESGIALSVWSDIAAQLGLAGLEGDATSCAEQLFATASTQRAAIVIALPDAGSWDRVVASAVARIAAESEGSGAPIVFVADARDAAIDVQGDRFEIAASLDADEKRQWWSAAADEAASAIATDDLAELDAWWGRTKSTSTNVRVDREVPPDGARLFAALSLVSRAWPLSALRAIGGDVETVKVLAESRAVRLERGFIAIDPTWIEQAMRAEKNADDVSRAEVARALAGQFPFDPWAYARAAELLIATGAHEEADTAHAAALTRAEDAIARREMMTRWMNAVDALDVASQLPLRTRASERALALGEAEEAHRWAQSLAVLAPNDAYAALLLGCAALAIGDVVSARVTLDRGRTMASDTEQQALFDVELAEIDYACGNLIDASNRAEKAIASSTKPSTILRARNTLGKILLANAKWDEADRHFAEDAWTSLANHLVTEELRARLNRGIAMLSKGIIDDARALFESVRVDAERNGDTRACAFALSNLGVAAMLRREYATALSLFEQTIKLRQRIGDRLTLANIANLADLRVKLGLFDHAEHAITFARRSLGAGMPATRRWQFGVLAARIALARGNTLEARREIVAAIADAEAAGDRVNMGIAYRVDGRIALEDGDVSRAHQILARSKDFATTDESRAEQAILVALAGRASGDGDAKAIDLATEALRLARVAGEDDLLREAQVLLAEIRSATGDADAARSHIDQALVLRDQVADQLAGDTRAAFLAQRSVLNLTRLRARLEERTPNDAALEEMSDEAAARTQRTSSRPETSPREIVGDDPAVRALLAAIRKVARTNSTVLVHGESGTGKELVAEALHRASERASGPLVTVNCAALVETLLLSELFGHEKGAFTGASSRRRGRFEMAEGGTLFLDEIGDISPRTQVALLRVLQERTFERVGGTTAIRANVRIVCATHRDLRAMVERGEFREDLYYRLRGITLEVPALRTRLGDLPRIADHLLARVAIERGEAKKTLASEAIELLTRHRWAGNVRELENALRAASIFAESNEITAKDLADNVDDLRALASMTPSRPSIPAPPATDKNLSAIELGDVDESGDGEASLPTTESGATAVAYAQVRHGAVSLSDLKRQIERDCIARALAETKGNITRAAALLGMKRPRLSQLVKQYGLFAVSSEAS